jgi:integrase
MELGLSVFILPADEVKDTDGRGDDRLVILNSIAAHIVDEQRGHHATHVFAYDGKPVTRMGNSAWYAARRRASLDQVRVHDLKHTFGRQLRAAGVAFEDRQDLLGHRQITDVLDRPNGPETQHLTRGAFGLLRPSTKSTLCSVSRRGGYLNAGP